MSELNNKSDLELLSDIQSGNSELIDEIILRYRSTVEALASKYIGSPLERDDLIQEGMIGLLAATKSYNSKKGAMFITYASRCIENSIKSAINKFTRLKDIPPASITELNEESFDDKYALSAEDEFLAKESVSALTDILYEGLSSFENEVLRLYVIGCSYTEIAQKLGKNPKAVDNAIQRIRKKLNGVTF